MNIYVYILPCVYGVQGSVRDLGQVYMENPPNLALPVVFTFQDFPLHFSVVLSPQTPSYGSSSQ